MTLTRRSAGPVEVISFSGTLDAALAPKARQELKDVIEEGRLRLLVDLSEVRFIDSSGLSVLVTALKTARAQTLPGAPEKRGDVALLKPTPPVRSILELTRLHRILEIFEDEAAAVAKLSA